MNQNITGAHFDAPNVVIDDRVIVEPAVEISATDAKEALAINAAALPIANGISAAAMRLHKQAQAQPKASPLLNSLIKRVVKEQEVKSQSMRWEHLVNMHSQIGQYLLNLTTIASFMRNRTLLNEVQDKELLLRLVKVLAKDMVDIQTRANANAEQYPIKSGEIIDDEEMLKAIGIYEVYNQILLDIVNVVMPNSNQVMEMFTVAERIIIEKEAIILAAQAEAAAAALINPLVVSDVVVKEATTTTEAVESLPQTEASALIDSAMVNDVPSADGIEAVNDVVAKPGIRGNTSVITHVDEAAFFQPASEPVSSFANAFDAAGNPIAEETIIEATPSTTTSAPV